jgi:penicillin-binding protein 1A
VNPDSTYYTSRELNLNLPQFGPWHVQTYSHSYSGTESIAHATLQSDNSVYAQLDLDLGPKEVRKTAYDMGVTTHLDALPAEGLGGLRLGVSPLEMANAYATLADGGVRNTPTAIKRVIFPPTASDPKGKTDDFGKGSRHRAFSDAVAYEVTKILKQNVQAGTGTAANYGCPAAGKTGTTDDFNDAWFVGYTPEMSTAVWVGYPDALRQMTSVHGIAVAGGTFPAQIWHNYMSTAHGTFCGDFPPPTSSISWKPFHGQYTSSSSGGYYSSTPSYTPQTGGGYDSNAYAPGAGQKPLPSPNPTPQTPNTGGNPGGGNGNGNGGGTGGPPH